MNCVELFTQKAKEHPERTAIWLSPEKNKSLFGDLLKKGAQVQRPLRT